MGELHSVLQGHYISVADAAGTTLTSWNNDLKRFSLILDTYESPVLLGGLFGSVLTTFFIE